MEKLKKLVLKENKEQIKKALDNLKKASDEELTDLWYYKDKLTNTQIKKHTNGEITTKELKEIIKNKIIKEYESRLNKDFKRINTIKESNEDIININIYINWTKSRTWGYNPHATIITNNGQTTEGRASGCGYDKESTAIAEALNKNNNILKLLYTAKNKKMTLKNNNNNDLLGYGSGYGSLPYFEGGVGVNSLLNIFRKLGYKIEEHHTKNNDFYIISKASYQNRNCKRLKECD